MVGNKQILIYIDKGGFDWIRHIYFSQSAKFLQPWIFVRQAFQQARAGAPSILFIDEIESGETNSSKSWNWINREARFAERIKAYEKIFDQFLDDNEIR